MFESFGFVPLLQLDNEHISGVGIISRISCTEYIGQETYPLECPKEEGGKVSASTHTLFVNHMEGHMK